MSGCHDDLPIFFVCVCPALPCCHKFEPTKQYVRECIGLSQEPDVAKRKIKRVKVVIKSIPAAPHSPSYISAQVETSNLSARCQYFGFGVFDSQLVLSPFWPFLWPFLAVLRPARDRPNSLPHDKKLSSKFYVFFSMESGLALTNINKNVTYILNKSYYFNFFFIFGSDALWDVILSS